ncbi:biliverdin-producing heme oxygenase [Colwellia sp. PAMC 21821]|uniref:biliverdin-producing heme oxygenase n=1 Tax=Colwellia sp. PAMC 21821 TaxID=1816219 RepID=UPI0009BFE198|nr:biliverdin-producing heme oxygenase [Colwellia sp. PAMC 21821]ARD46210.1 hypothetical protein A3Q33_19105 [Colwellia sp. PAMC 21821]
MLLPLSEQLKQATSPYHRELDKLPVLRNLMSASLSAEQYEAAMLYFYQCFNAWQPTLDAAVKLLTPPAFSIIDNQLSALSTETDSFSYQFNATIAVPKPIISSVDEYLGYSYVLTGAQLGARFILRKLQKSPLAEHYGFNYYANVSQNTIDINHWKLNLDALVKQGNCEQQAVIDAATTCFTQLITWFAQEAKISNKQSLSLAHN